MAYIMTKKLLEMIREMIKVGILKRRRASCPGKEVEQ